MNLHRDGDQYFTILIYVPSFGRAETCLNQVKNLASQISNLDPKKIGISLILSVNHDNSYDESTFKKHVSEFTNLPFNYGANLNISFGFQQALNRNFDYLWIVGDDEPLPVDALNLIVETITSQPESDLIIGSKNYIGILKHPTSFGLLNRKLGGSISFITSTIYKVKFTKNDFLKAMEFGWTQFPHLVIINRLIARGNVTQVSCIKLSEICHVEQRIHGYPPPNSSNMGIRDSSVFFGKVLSTLGSDSSDYRKQEFKLWAKENWHRISMYKKPEEYRGLLAYSLAMEYSGLGTLMHLSKLPIWRIKSMVLIRTLRGLK